MDEFDKIKEVSEGIVGRQEPHFAEEGDDADNYHFESDLDRMPSLDSMTESDRTMKTHFMALGGLGVLLIIAVVILFCVGSNQGDETIPVISPTPNPVKVKPENPGGMAIPDQDKMIYNRLASAPAQPKVEKLFPEPEKPVLPEILIQQNTPEQPFIEVEDIPAINPLEAETPEIKLEDEKANIEKLPADPVIQTKQVKTVAKPISVSVAQKTTEVWRVQLFATSKKDAAEKAWKDISKKQKALLSDISHEIVAAKIPGKGTFYRVQAGQFSSKEMAANLCTKLKAKKQDCVPVKAE